MKKRYLVSFLIGVLVFPVLFVGTTFVFAQSEIDRLKEQIDERNDRLSDIEKEIAEYESLLQEVGAEKDTLQRAINQLELERKKINADIRFTENRIQSTDLEINKLALEISDTARKIAVDEEGIAEIIRAIRMSDDDSLLEILLRHENLSEFWGSVEDLQTIKNKVSEQVALLEAHRTILEEKKTAEDARKAQLEDLKDQYDGQHSVLSNNQSTKTQLLSRTKNEEAEYQALLREKQEARDQLLAEVRDIESKLQFILDPNTIPTPGTAVFIWPLDNPRITQNFGYTKFALSGAYNGNQHNGMDLGAPVGTKLKAPLTGTVRMIGDTDQVRGCYSWGKWLLIDHPNGLSSMFAHLSHIGVVPGQTVSTGDIVGYVGNTGYSTGPHLHYTLYVTKGVEVKRFNEFKSVTGCGSALTPIAAVEAYLDPLLYLPRI